MTPKIQLKENEEILFQCQPRKSLLGYLILRYCLYLPIILFMLSISLVSADEHSKNSLTSIINSLVLYLFNNKLSAFSFFSMIILILAWHVTKIYKYSYIFTNQRCILYSKISGIKKNLPYNRIVEIKTRPSFLKRIFGITTVSLDQKYLAEDECIDLHYGGLWYLNTFFNDSSQLIIDSLTDQSAKTITTLIKQNCSRLA